MRENAVPDARPATGRPMDDQDDEIDLLALFGTLWRGKWIIAAVAAVAVLIGGYYAFVMATPIYTASSAVALESREEQVVDMASVMTGLSGDQAVINTEVEVLRSRILMERLVNRLNLTEDPEFNTRLREEPSFSPGIAIGWVKSLLLGPEPAQPDPTNREVLDATIDNLIQTISVSNVRQSYVFRITAETESPRKSALIANTLADLYIEDQLQVKFDATEQASSWLSERVAELRTDLEAAETAVKDFSASTDLISREALTALNVQVKDIRERLATVRETAAAARARLGELQDARDTGDRAVMAEVAGDSTLTRILTMLDNGTAEGPGAFDARYQAVLDRAELEVSRAEAQVASLEQSLEELNAQIESQSADLVELEQLEREAEANRLIYESFLTRLKEISVQQGIQQADSRILSRAVVPRGPSEPRTALILALSMVLGLMVGAGLVLLREMLHNGIRTAEDLERLTGLNVIGQVPLVPAKVRNKVLDYLAEKPASPAAEAVRNLRTSLVLSNVDNPPQVIMITSSVPGEGKTTDALALAQNFAGLGKKVLLIEGDIRRRVFTQYFDITEPRGLLAVLSGTAEPEEVVHYDERLKADLLPSEKSSINAADVFSSESFRTFLVQARETYDFIIIDTPPVLVVPDARVIGQSSDAIIYAVKWDSTTKQQVIEGLRQFSTIGLKVTGLLLAQINPAGMKRYGYGDRYGAYSSYGRKYYE